MSQTVFGDINPATKSGNQLATDLNAFKAAFLSKLSGTSRPAAAVPGTEWLDTSDEGDDIWTVKLYDGTDDIDLYSINLATGTVSVTSSDSLFSITKISADATGPLFKLIKKRIANGGQVSINDVVGEAQFVGTDDTGAATIVSRIKSMALEAMTTAAAGAALVFETVSVGSTSLSEVLRITNERVSIGGNPAPEAGLHVKHQDGVIVEKASDDAAGSVLAIRKTRVTGTGAVQNSDVLASIQAQAMDSNSDVASTAKIEAVATEGHTPGAKGTRISVSVMETGENAYTEKIRLADQITLYGRSEIEALKLTSQNIATAASITAMNGDKCVVRFTGATATLLQGIAATGVSKTILIHNTSSANVTVVHDHAGATAANRFSLPKSKNIVLLPLQSTEVFYDETDSRWKLRSGSGGGGGELSVIATQTIADGGVITISTIESRMMSIVSASGTTGLLSTTPFGAFSSTSPVEYILIGGDDEDTILIPFNDAQYGCIGDFEDEGYIEISRKRPVKALWVPETERFYVSRGV